MASKFQPGRVIHDGIKPQRFVAGQPVEGSRGAYVALAPASLDSDRTSYVSPPLGLQGGTDRILIEGETSAPGTIYLDVAPGDNGPWTQADSEVIPAGIYLQAVATTSSGEGAYRVRFVPTAALPSKLLFVAQARP